MEDNIVNHIICLHREGKWKEIGDIYHDHPERSRVLWVFPSAENLAFVGDNLRAQGCSRLVSVGCGSGLLEWMITQATATVHVCGCTLSVPGDDSLTVIGDNLRPARARRAPSPDYSEFVIGLPVSGVEVDGAWWRCKYAPPTFIPLLLTAPTLDKDVVRLLRNCSTTALLFCYFNNRPAFEEYVKHFSGKVLVIIGPGDGKGVHTDPKPFGDLSGEWILQKYQEVRSSFDFIAVYRRD